MTTGRSGAEIGIWGLAFGYFACYVPYSALTKVLSSGKLPTMEGPIKGLSLLPSTTIASLCGMMVFLAILLGTGGRWGRLARPTPLGRLVLPGRWTFLSGVCTAGVIATTTMAYTFSGVSIVFMMLLMRGGVLMLAPIVDALSKRRVQWFSWVALGLSLASLLVAFSGDSYELTLLAAADVILYLGCYFVRLRFMCRLAKSDAEDARLRYFVEEQMVATPAIVTILALVALLGGHRPELAPIREGFTAFSSWSGEVQLAVLAVGLFSQGTGIFGGLVLLDKRENTFCVPVNRASSVLAGLVATWSLAVIFGTSFGDVRELIGATLVVVAILFLSLPPLLARRRQAVAAPSPTP